MLIQTVWMTAEAKREVINRQITTREESIMDASPIEVCIAGRMMFKRVMGKASFCKYSGLKGQVFRFMWQGTLSVRIYMQTSRNLTSVISAV